MMRIEVGGVGIIRRRRRRAHFECQWPSLGMRQPWRHTAPITGHGEHTAESKPPSSPLTATSWYPSSQPHRPLGWRLLLSAQ